MYVKIYIEKKLSRQVICLRKINIIRNKSKEKVMNRKILVVLVNFIRVKWMGGKVEEFESFFLFKWTNVFLHLVVKIVCNRKFHFFQFSGVDKCVIFRGQLRDLICPAENSVFFDKRKKFSQTIGHYWSY